MGACINFACGAVEALSVKVGVRDAGDEDETWRGRQRPEELAVFDRLRDVRIEDFHYGILDTKSGHKWVNAATIRGVTVFPGPPDATVEERNPGGDVVRARALAEIRTLYIEHDGKQIDAAEACRRFIALREPCHLDVVDAPSQDDVARATEPAPPDLAATASARPRTSGITQRLRSTANAESGYAG